MKFRFERNHKNARRGSNGCRSKQDKKCHGRYDPGIVKMEAAPLVSHVS